MKTCVFLFLMMMGTAFSPEMAKYSKKCLQDNSYPYHSESQFCLNGCKAGWYGPFCNIRCYRKCKFHLCHQYDGTCIYGCDEHWLQQFRSHRCYRSLRKQIKRSMSNCIVEDQDGCKCCKQKYGGINCDIFCENCDTYNRGGLCKNFCKEGYYGSTCNSTCPRNCEISDKSGKPLCEQNSPNIGKCHGCISGYYGEKCNNTCSKLCKNETCRKDNGKCVYCEDIKFHGPNCSIPCSNKCLNRTCHINGTCYRMCPNNCETGAPKSSLCTQNESKYLQCRFGCQSGYYGLSCNQTCSTDCSNGTCSSNCTLSNCQGDNSTSHCIGGCLNGYRRNHCQENIRNVTAPHKTTPATITARAEGINMPLVVCLPLFFVILCVAVTICIYKKRCIPMRCGHNYRINNTRQGEVTDEEQERLNEGEEATNIEILTTILKYSVSQLELSPLSDVSKSRSLPCQLNNTGLNGSQLDEDRSIPQQHSPLQTETILHSKSCSKIDEAACIERNKDMAPLEREKEDRREDNS